MEVYTLNSILSHLVYYQKCFYGGGGSRLSNPAMYSTSISPGIILGFTESKAFYYNRSQGTQFCRLACQFLQ